MTAVAAASAPPLLVGRSAELSVVRGMVSAVAAGRGGVLLVAGEPGVGKSALVRAGISEARGLGCAVAWGVGEELTRAFPLVPFLSALGAQGPAGESGRADLLRVLRGEVGWDLTSGVDAAVAASERLLSVVDDLTVAAPLVLVVDDLHWADEATVLVWHRLARSVDQIPLLLVGMARPVPVRAELRVLRQGVADQPAGRVIELERLSSPAVAELVGGLVEGRPGRRLLRLAEDAGGNPLYVTELVASLRRAGSLVAGSGQVEAASVVAPGSLAAAIADRLDFLPGDVREVLSAAAMLGVQFGVGELSLVLERSAVELSGPLQEAWAAGVLAEVDGVLGFRHQLIWAALYEQVAPSMRVAWHQEAARALAAAGMPAVRVAGQLLAAYETGVASESGPRWLVDWLVEHAAEIIAQSAGVAAALLRRVVAAGSIEGPSRAVLQSRLAVSLSRAGEVEEAKRVAAEALAHEVEPDQLVELHTVLADCRSITGQFEEALADLEEALSAPALNNVHLARLRVLIARTYMNSGRPREAADAFRDALAAGRGAGDRWSVAWALNGLLACRYNLGEVHPGSALHTEALTLAADDPDLADLRLLVRLNHTIALLVQARYEEAERVLRALRQEADRAGNVPRRTESDTLLVFVLFETGRWDEALAEVQGHERGGRPDYEAELSGTAALIALHRGDTGTARLHLASAVPFAERAGHLACPYYAMACALELEVAGAMREAATLLGSYLAEHREFVSEVEFMFADAVRVAVASGDVAAARGIAGDAEEMAAATGRPHLRVAALFCRGLVDRDADLLNEAAAYYRKVGWLLPLAQSVEALAAVWVRRGESERARRAFNEALDVYQALDAAWDVSRVRARFREDGLRRSPHAKRRPATGWASLTVTEVKIAGMVADGMSNPGIAERLFLSRRTVQSHVSHILAKLDLHSRVDVAREAIRHEPTS